MGDGTLNLVQVVRRYGPVGGSERYVYELTRALAARGHRVTVVCGRRFALPPPDVAVHEVGETLQRPRWLCQWRFRRRVRAWLAAHRPAGALVHSHERLDAHDLSTYHGPPFAVVRTRPLWRRLSLRVRMQLELEGRELTTARAIVPVSSLVATQLAALYPEHRARVSAPVAPGIDGAVTRPARVVPDDGGVVGFVGKEWRRKGLPLALAIVAELQRRRPRLELHVVGPDADEVRALFANWTEGFRLLGWRAEQDYRCAFDVLLHPAKAEPYGMVITEAMAARIPVVVSDACGAAADVGPDAGRVVPLRAPLADWVEAVEAQLARAEPPRSFTRNWDTVAQDYEAIYRGLAPSPF